MSHEPDIPPSAVTPSAPAPGEAPADGFSQWDAAAPDPQGLALDAVSDTSSQPAQAQGHIDWVAPQAFEPDPARKLATADAVVSDGRGAKPPAGADASPRDGGGPPPPRVHKLRLFLIVAGLLLIGLSSTVFGMMMAVASDLPALEDRAQYRNARNSVLLDVRGRSLGVLTGKENRVLVAANQISTAMQHAIISIEDRRFYQHDGVDYRGIGRALWTDVAHRGAVQGASTIPQQFVKNALAAQHQRTLFQKLREAALAYHLTRKWSKSKILTEYLNTVYFGNGAYGIESAARVYWTWRHQGCGTTPGNACASELTAGEAALLAGIVASPSGYDPIAHPQAAAKRRAQVLSNMVAQGYLTDTGRQEALAEPLPTRNELTYPEEDSKAPYFTTWVKQQVVDKFGAQQAFGGGLRIRTTLDLELQKAAEQSVTNHLPSPNGPRAALVAIDNYTGEVRAMVGGSDYAKHPFNLATQGQRQPGSSFKPFTVAVALQQGISPDSVWSSQPKKFVVPNSGGKEFFRVNNYEGEYTGSNTLSGALAASDNSIFAEVGIKVGVGKVADMAARMGIRTPISRNDAITLGGLKQGVTPLDMAHAYSTFAQRGQRIYGSLGASDEGPVGIHDVRRGNKVIRVNQRETERVFSGRLADQAQLMLQGVVSSGTGRAAALGATIVAGKTGTTENYGDAWFVGFTKKYTVAVWVGYPNSVKSMATDYNGGPVAGGTFPALIFHDFMASTLELDAQRQATADAAKGVTSDAGGASPDLSGSDPSGTGLGTTGDGGTGSGTQDGTTGGAPGQGDQGAPQGGAAPTPAPTPAAPTPAPTPAPPPTGGGGGGGNGGSGGTSAGGTAPPG